MILSRCFISFVQATARQDHYDILQGGATARRKRQRQRSGQRDRGAARKGWREWTLSAAENTRLQALEYAEADDDAVLEDFRERK